MYDTVGTVYYAEYRVTEQLECALIRVVATLANYLYVAKFTTPIYIHVLWCVLY